MAMDPVNGLIRGDTNIALMQAARQDAAHKAQVLEQQKTVKNFEKIDAAAKDFEAVFLSEMLKPMFKEINEADPLFGGGHGEEVFNGFMVQEYGKLMAQRGGIGLADHVREELLKIQEAKSHGDGHSIQ